MPFSGLTDEQKRMNNQRVIDAAEQRKAAEDDDWGIGDVLALSVKLAPLVALAYFSGGASLAAGGLEAGLGAEAGVGAIDSLTADSVIETGASAAGQDALLGGAGADVLAGTSDAMLPANLGNAWEGAAADSAAQNAALEAAPGATPDGGGLIDWARNNKMLAYGAMQVGTGIVGGIGQNLTQNQLMDKRIQADKDLLEQKKRNAQELEEWRRRFTQSGSYFDAAMPVSKGPSALTRPGGAPVYDPNGGLIASQMNKGTP